MSWECKTVEKLREEFVQAAANGEKISKLCREFGISRPTAYKWMKRAQAGESMSDQSRRPKQIANRVAAHVEEKVLEMRTANPGWGGENNPCRLTARRLSGLALCQNLRQYSEAERTD